MESTQQLEVMPPQTQQSLEVRQDRGPLSVAQVSAALKLIHEVMKNCMVEDQDYGKIPGCGDKPGLFQPGAQKLSLMFQLNPEVQQEIVTDYPNYHRGYRLVVRVKNGSKIADGVGECSTMESKYRYRSGDRKCPSCGQPTVFKSKKGPEKWYCWAKKGGCGETFMPDSESAVNIDNQDTGKVEHDNPADFWNTVRKMAFKRGFVHAIINATNTSELWSQDLEDLAENGVVGRSDPKPATRQAPTPKSAPAATQESTQAPQDAHNVEAVMFVDFKEVNGKPPAKWTAWFCKFETDSGSQFEAGTFDRKIADKLDVLLGTTVELAHKPGKKPGTKEIVSIEPIDGIPV